MGAVHEGSGHSSWFVGRGPLFVGARCELLYKGWRTMFVRTSIGGKIFR